MSEPIPVVTGTGIICSVGCNADEVWSSLTKGISGLAPLTVCHSARHGTAPVGEIKTDIDNLCGKTIRGSRTDKLAYIATKQVIANSQLEDPSLRDKFRIGLLIGNTVGGILGTERFLHGLLHENTSRYGMLRYHECASATDLCAGEFNCTGPTTTISTACSGGAMAIAMAAELIKTGESDVIIAGGCDSLCQLTVNGFGSLLLLDPEGCRPFDENRVGISLGEGAAMLAIESEQSAKERGVPILAYLTGWGYSCDAFHATAPSPEGEGAYAAMKMALKRAKLSTTSISHINAHGTGTPGNDLAETKAIRHLFGSNLPPILSTKGFFGHTLGASGAIDAVVCIKSIECGGPPASARFETIDPEIGFAPVKEHGSEKQNHILNNAFGFGGNNVSLVFSNPENTTNLSSNSTDISAGQMTPATDRKQEFTISGIGMVVPLGSELQSIFAACTPNGAEPFMKDIQEPFPQKRMPVYSCPDDFGAKDEIPARRRRRLERIQQMTIVAANRSCQNVPLDDIEKDRISVAIGTGLGASTATAAFVEPFVADENIAPSPQKFTNAVHNALASQVALEMTARGLNSTITHRETSFESALWHGTQELAEGNSDYSIIGAADELTPYLLSAGIHWGWWNETTPAIKPLSSNVSNRQKALPGEGATVFCLTLPENADNAIAIISAVSTGRFTLNEESEIDADLETKWIESALARNGKTLNDIDIILSGANGDLQLDTMYSDVVEAINRKAKKKIRHGCYKHLCGEHHSASAFGMAMAAGLVSGQIAPATLLADEGDCKAVLLYTISPKGTHAISCITKP